MQCACTVFLSVICPVLPYFSTLSHKRYHFRGGGGDTEHKMSFFYVLLTVHLSIFISVINQLDAQNFCFIISLFHASTCFEHCVLIIRLYNIILTS